MCRDVQGVSLQQHGLDESMSVLLEYRSTMKGILKHHLELLQVVKRSYSDLQASKSAKRKK